MKALFALTFILMAPTAHAGLYPHGEISGQCTVTDTSNGTVKEAFAITPLEEHEQGFGLLAEASSSEGTDIRLLLNSVRREKLLRVHFAGISIMAPVVNGVAIVKVGAHEKGPHYISCDLRVVLSN